jgi:hypothetical protein
LSEDIAKIQRLARVAQAFRPSAPVDRYAMLAGRRSKIMETVGAVSQAGQHVALYGERGVGKTSLTNILGEIFDTDDLPDYQWARVNCNTEDTFTSLWRTIFRELGIEDDETSIAPEDVRWRLAKMGRPAVLVIDELDRLADDEALTLLADTIKTLSDHIVESTLVLVGVASSLDDLVGEHGSIDRALVQVEMPRMSPSELGEILDKGCSFIGLGIKPEAAMRITDLSEGLPHFTHLLAFHASQRVIADDRHEITAQDVAVAIDSAVSTHTIRTDYHRATRSTRDETLYPQVLLACALAQKDSGVFPAGAVRAPLKAITGRAYDIPAFAPHLKKFLEPERGGVLRREGEPRRRFYRFTNPLMQPYVILHALSSGFLTEDALLEIRGEPPTTDDSPSDSLQLF